MEVLAVYLIGVLAALLLMYMLIKKFDIKVTLLGTGLLLMYIAIAFGNETPGGTEYAILNPIMAIVLQFRNTLQGPGLVILLLGGYASFMQLIKANEITVYGLTKPLKKIKSPYVLVPIVFLLGNLLSLVIPSASNLAIILLATLYPVLKKAGLSNLTAAAVLATTATIVPTPLGSDNVAVAAELGMSVTQYVFSYHAIISIPALLLMAVVHSFWQKFMDKRDAAKGIVDNNELSFDQLEEIPSGKLFRLVYGTLPLLPIIILLVLFAVNNTVYGADLPMGVELVTIFSFIIAIFVELIRKKNVREVLQSTESFFTGMGNNMGIVALLVCAGIFVSGLNSIGIISQLQDAMANATGAGYILPFVMVGLTAVVVLLSGSGVALFFAMIPLMVPLAAAAGIDPVALAIPMGLTGNLLRAVSPVAAVVVIVAGATKENPINIIKRTSVPMIAGVILTVVLSLILFV